MKLLPSMLAAIILCLSPKALPGEEPSKTLGLDNPFFAFDNSAGFRKLSVDEQAETLKKLGYTGIGYDGSKNIPKMLEALDKVGLKMNSIYVWARIGPKGPTFDQGIKTAIEQLKGRDTVIWLTVQGKANGDKESLAQAVEVVSQIGRLAKTGGLRVALYPHVGFYVATTEDALRVVKKVDMENVGVTLNLCHRLKIDGDQKMQETIKNAMPHLFMVSINGADSGDTKNMDWKKLIQRLDRGSYDVYGFLKTLRKLGYKGPIGLQCYNVSGDAKENLAGSISAWKKFVAKMATE